jgi:hypothetical protein
MKKGVKMDITNITMIVLIAVVALLIGGLLGIKLGRQQRTKNLQQKFGPEYDHTVDELGDRQQAEHELTTRVSHVKALEIRPLSQDEIEHFTSRWQANQVDFVDEPLAAIQKADQLISQVMKAKGYPIEDFEQQAADISVDYPNLVRDYRGLHLIAIKGRDDVISTEEMRQAMIHGRDLFNILMRRDETADQPQEKEKI